MTRDDVIRTLEILRTEEDPTSPAIVSDIALHEAALAGDQEAWTTLEEAERKFRAEEAALYAGEYRVHYSPADFRDE